MVDTDASAPFDAGDGPQAALLLHGLTSTPYELRPVAESLVAAGIRAKIPRLVGHGTRPEVLRHTRWTDWLGSARRAFDQLSAQHDSVFIIGTSAGALAALALAHERGQRVGGVVAMATPLELTMRNQLALRMVHRVPPLSDLVPYLAKKTGPDVSDPAIAAAMPSYDRVPLASAVSLLDGQTLVQTRAPLLTTPVLIQHGRHDHTAPVRNAKALMALLRTPYRRAIIYPRSWHILALDIEHESVRRDVVAFVQNPSEFTRK